MMKKVLTAVVIFSLFVACQTNEKSNENAQKNTTENKAVQKTTPQIALADFDSLASRYVGKEIKVKGIVDHICKHGGKKLFLVDDNANLHVEADSRFDESLAGSEVIVTGIVKEFRVDEAYCLKMDEDNIKSHSEGKTNDKLFEQKKKQIAFYRDSMEKAGTDHLSFYSLEFVSLTEPDKE